MRITAHRLARCAPLSCLLLIFLLEVPVLAASKRRSVSRSPKSVDRALAIAIDAAQPFVRDGFLIREEYWSGTLSEGGQRVIQLQLFKGNDYYFLVGTTTRGAVFSVHIYDENGDLADLEYWKKTRAAGAAVRPRRSGSFYVVVSVDATSTTPARWALAYAFR